MQHLCWVLVQRCLAYGSEVCNTNTAQEASLICCDFRCVCSDMVCTETGKDLGFRISLSSVGQVLQRLAASAAEVQVQ